MGSQIDKQTEKQEDRRERNEVSKDGGGMVWAVGIREGTKHCRLRGNKGLTEMEEEEG